jgi:Tfp pilus assembly protein FimT
MNCFKTKKAFTLVEILVSIGIIFLTVGMSATFIKNYAPNIKINSASRDLKNNIQRARSLSVSLQQEHGILFREANNSYDLIKLTQNPPIIIESFALPDEITFDSVGNFLDDTVSFNFDGSASQSGIISIKNSNNKIKNININPSGYVSID